MAGEAAAAPFLTIRELSGRTILSCSIVTSTLRFAASTAAVRFAAAVDAAPPPLPLAAPLFSIYLRIKNLFYSCITAPYYRICPKACYFSMPARTFCATLYFRSNCCCIYFPPLLIVEEEARAATELWSDVFPPLAKEDCSCWTSLLLPLLLRVR
jgi:hypothetical protein